MDTSFWGLWGCDRYTVCPELIVSLKSPSKAELPYLVVPLVLKRIQYSAMIGNILESKIFQYTDTSLYFFRLKNTIDECKPFHKPTTLIFLDLLRFGHDII